MADSGQFELEARRVDSPILVNGKLDDPRWQHAVRTPRFVDMASGNPALLDTTAAALWDDERLYLAFWIEEPYPTARFTERDSIIFRENDVEVFIDGGDAYYELEVNALGTVYEVFFIWRDSYIRGGRFDVPEFDPVAHQAYVFGGDDDRMPETFWEGSNPRGTRWAFRDWDFPGLECKAHVTGALNDRSRPSKGWTVEIALPWEGMKHLANGRPLPPREGDVWKLFLGRFQKIEIGSREVQAAWCATPHGRYDTHMPDKFTPVRFTRASAG